MATPKFHDLLVKSTRPQTADGVAITFSVPEALKETFTFTPGQYLTLRATIDGQDVRRSYSICSAEGAEGLEVGIKRVEGGLFSNYAFGLEPGDSVSIMPPQGRFTAKVGGTHHYVLFAAGSGITPCLSIAKSVLEAEPESTVTLVFGNSNTATVMFRDDLDILKDRYTGRFMLSHVLSREQQDADILNGRVDGALVETLQKRGLISVELSDAIYICGPQEMIENVSQTLQRLGVEEAKIRFELFTTPDSAHRKPPQKVDTATSDANVDIIIDGGHKLIAADARQDTILTAARKSGIELPFSCAGGMCCTCRCKVVSGEVSMDVNYSLQD